MSRVNLCLVDYFPVARQRTLNAWMENHQHHDHGAGPNKQTSSKNLVVQLDRGLFPVEITFVAQYGNIGRLLLAVVSSGGGYYES